MATPTITHHSLAGALGPILVDIRATSRQARQPAVVILHGFKGFKDYAFLPPMGERLARAGFTAVNVSVSGSGVDERGDFNFPERFARNTYSRELDDVTAVIAALRAGEFDTSTPASIGIIGHSRGGGVALCVARETPEIGAVVTWGAIATINRFTDAEMAIWRKAGRIEVMNARTRQLLPMDHEIVDDALAHRDRFDIGAAAATLTRPWLLVHAVHDETVPVAEARELAARATDARFESLFTAGGGHTFGASHPWAGPTPETEQVFGATVGFLSRHLR